VFLFLSFSEEWGVGLLLLSYTLLHGFWVPFFLASLPGLIR